MLDSAMGQMRVKAAFAAIHAIEGHHQLFHSGIIGCLTPRQRHDEEPTIHAQSAGLRNRVLHQWGFPILAVADHETTATRVALLVQA